MGYKEDLKEFWVRHIKSYVKTYVTIFLIIYLKDIVGDAKEGEDFILLNFAVIIPAMKWAVLAVLRNLYKMLTEK